MKYLQNRLLENEDWGRFVFMGEEPQSESLHDTLSQQESVGIVDVDQDEADEYENKILEFATGIEETVKTLSLKEQKNILKELKKLDTKYEKEKNTEFQGLQAGLIEIREKYLGLTSRVNKIVKEGNFQGSDLSSDGCFERPNENWIKQCLNTIPSNVSQEAKNAYTNFLIGKFKDKFNKLPRTKGNKIKIIALLSKGEKIQKEMEALTFDQWQKEQEEEFIGPPPTDKEKKEPKTRQATTEEGQKERGVEDDNESKTEIKTEKDDKTPEETSISDKIEKEQPKKTAPAKTERVTNPDEVQGKNWHKDVGGIGEDRDAFRKKHYEKRVERMNLSTSKINTIANFSEQTISKEGGYLFGALVKGLGGEFNSAPEAGKKSFDKNSDQVKQAFLILKKLSEEGVNVDKFNPGDKISIENGVFKVNGTSRGELYEEPEPEPVNPVVNTITDKEVTDPETGILSQAEKIIDEPNLSTNQETQKIEDIFSEHFDLTSEEGKKALRSIIGDEVEQVKQLDDNSDGERDPNTVRFGFDWEGWERGAQGIDDPIVTIRKNENGEVSMEIQVGGAGIDTADILQKFENLKPKHWYSQRISMTKNEYKEFKAELKSKIKEGSQLETFTENFQSNIQKLHEKHKDWKRIQKLYQEKLAGDGDYWFKKEEESGDSSSIEELTTTGSEGGTQLEEAEEEIGREDVSALTAEPEVTEVAKLEIKDLCLFGNAKEAFADYIEKVVGGYSKIQGDKPTFRSNFNLNFSKLIKAGTRVGNNPEEIKAWNSFVSTNNINSFPATYVDGSKHKEWIKKNFIPLNEKGEAVPSEDQKSTISTNAEKQSRANEERTVIMNKIGLLPTDTDINALDLREITSETISDFVGQIRDIMQSSKVFESEHSESIDASEIINKISPLKNFLKVGTSFYLNNVDIAKKSNSLEKIENVLVSYEKAEAYINASNEIEEMFRSAGYVSSEKAIILPKRKDLEKIEKKLIKENKKLMKNWKKNLFKSVTSFELIDNSNTKYKVEITDKGFKIPDQKISIYASDIIPFISEDEKDITAKAIEEYVLYKITH